MEWKQVTEVVLPIVATHGIRVIAAMVGFWVAMRLASAAQHRVTNALRSREFDTTLSIFFGNFVRWLLMVVSVIAILGVFGVETSSFAAVIGAAGLAAGLAFQGTLSNFSAGVMLLVFRPFKVGDRIEIGPSRGTVMEIGIFSTILDTTDKRRKILPNSLVNTAVIENHSVHEERRVDVTCWFAAEAPPDKIRALLDRVGAKWNRPLSGRAHYAVVKRLHPHGSEWELRCYAPMREHNDLVYGMQEDVLQGMAEAGISAPGALAELHQMRR